MHGPDPWIADQIQRALGRVRTVLSIGPGAGTYEPDGARVVAVEPRPDTLPRSAVVDQVVIADAEALSDLTRRIRDEEQRDLAFEAHRTAHELIGSHRDLLELLAQELLANETIERNRIDEIMAGVPRIARRPAEPRLRIAAASRSVAPPTRE